MSKLASMMKVFKREKKNQSSVEGSSSRSKKGRRSVLDRDSFVFMPGDSGAGGPYWGEIINDDSFPNSQRQDSRRKTLLIDPDSGLQEVNLVIRTRLEASEKDDQILLNGKIFRRHSETTLPEQPGEGKGADDDVPVLRDYAFLLSNKEHQDIPRRYVYDRLIRAPLQSANPLSQQKRMTLVADSRTREDLERYFMRKDLQANNASTKYAGDGWSVPDEHAERSMGKQRPASMYSSHSSYSGLEWTHSKAFPADAVSWELNLEGMNH